MANTNFDTVVTVMLSMDGALGAEWLQAFKMYNENQVLLVG